MVTYISDFPRYHTEQTYSLKVILIGFNDFSTLFKPYQGSQGSRAEDHYYLNFHLKFYYIKDGTSLHRLFYYSNFGSSNLPPVILVQAAPAANCEPTCAIALFKPSSLPLSPDDYLRLTWSPRLTFLLDFNRCSREIFITIVTAGSVISFFPSVYPES